MSGESTEAAGEVVMLKQWVCVEFPHFVGVRHLGSEEWAKVFLKPTGAELDVEALGKRVRLHANGIEFLDGVPPAGEVIPFPGPKGAT